MKLKSLKLANAVTLGPETVTFMKDDMWDMELDEDMLISISNKRHPERYCVTSIFNTICLTPQEVGPGDAHEEGDGSGMVPEAIKRAIYKPRRRRGSVE